MKFRELKAEEIDVRQAQLSDKGCSVLLYKDARCDMNILDETVGSEGWQRKHYDCKGNLFCSVGIKCGEIWVWKDDCGSESNVEKEKGEASDSFKRACFNWGIGRELYTSPFLWIPVAKLKLDVKNGKNVTYDKFSVEKIEYSNGQITALTIINQRSETVFDTFKKSKQGKPPITPPEEIPPVLQPRISPIKAKVIDDLALKHNLSSTLQNSIDASYHVKTVGELSETQGDFILIWLNKKVNNGTTV
jgi:hypothetical protein